LLELGCAPVDSGDASLVTGLGLTVVQKIIQDHGGDVAVDAAVP